MAAIDAGSFQILVGGEFGGFPQYFLKVDWDQNGVFDNDEELSSDAMSVFWNRGREAEEENTPGGTLTFTVNDPFGDYVPGGSTSKWGSTNVTIDREVSLRIVYKDSTFPSFRGRISKITPNLTAIDQSATVFCVDGMDELGTHVISAPVASGSTGGVVNSGGQPIQDSIPGGIGESTLGLIARVLDAAGWSTGRRDLSENGENFDWWWAYRENARVALNKIESHERGVIFINGNGDVQFQSSTHRNNSTQIASFNSDFQQWQYALSGRSIRNAVEISTHLRRIALSTEPDSSTVGFVQTVSGLADFPDITSGSTFTTTVVFDKGPAITVITPEIGVNGGGEVALVGASGTSHLGEINGVLLAGSAMRLTIVNSTADETVTVNAVEGSSGQFTLQMRAIHLSDSVLTSTANDTASIARHTRRALEADYIFFDNESKGSSRAQSIIDRFATARADFTRFTLQGSDSNSITQIISREIGDKVRVTSTNLHISNRDYHISAGDWEILPGNGLSVTWSLEQST